MAKPRSIARFLLPATVILLPAALLWPLWSCPTSAGEDDVVFFYPLRVLVAGELARGNLPEFNPTVACGSPLMGDPQTGTFFPPNWLFLFLPAGVAYSLCIFLAFSVAGAGAWAYLRRIGLSHWPCSFGSLAFMFCGFLVGHRVHLGVIQTASLLPWGLYALELLAGAESLRQRHPQAGTLEGGTQDTGCLATASPAGCHASPSSGEACLALPERRGVLGAVLAIALVFALALAAGHWPTVIHMSLIWGVYLLLRCRPLGKALLVAAGGAALACAVMYVQIWATLTALHLTIRSALPYSTVGENSFFPLCGALALFPFLMGNRAVNFFDQPWWGPWHQCEMLGYVGLVTLVLALAAIIVLFRRPRAAADSPAAACATLKRYSAWGCGTGQDDRPADALRPLARTWMWLGLGSLIWMLGTYLPTYRLIYVLPVLGKVRAPGRMVLGVDMALAVLAALGLQLLCGDTPLRARIGPLLKRLSWLLPAAMAATLGGLAALSFITTPGSLMEAFLSAPAGQGRQAILDALRPTNPALWVPVILAAATVLLLRIAARKPARAWILVLLLAVDLGIVARFVDIPGRGQPCPSPTASPAAAWLHKNAASQPYRVWGLSKAYCDRPAELLLPNTCSALGIETISYYGPLQSLDHAALLGFRPWGENNQWAWLVRTNHLLSLFNVRYLVAADDEYRHVIESVRVLAAPEGKRPNLFGGTWDVQTGAQAAGEGFSLAAPKSWSMAELRQGTSLRPGQVYRIALDARAAAGAGNYLIAGCFADLGPSWWQDTPTRLRVDAEQLDGDWRHFEWTFQAPASPAGPDRADLEPAYDAIFRVITTSTKPVDVRNISLREAFWEAPYDRSGRLTPGEPVYIDRTPEGLPAVRAGDKCVHIYENRLVLPRQFDVEEVIILPTMHDVIEALRWGADRYDFSRQVLMARHSPFMDHPVAFASLNRGLTQARQGLWLAKAFFAPADVLGSLWPGTGKTAAITQTSQPSRP